MNRMNIGLITGEFAPMQGGVGDFTGTLAEALAAQGHAISILTDARGNKTAAYYHNSPVIRRWGFGTLSTVREWVSKRRVEVVNLQFETAAYAMSPWIHLVARAIHPVPLVTTFHDLHEPYLFPKAGVFRRGLMNYLARHSARVIVTNPEDAATLRGRGFNHITEIPIGSNIPVNPPIGYDRIAWRREYYQAEHDQFVIGYFGFMNASKGVDELLRALYHVRERNASAKLVLIGGKTGSSDPANLSFAEHLQFIIQSLNLQEMIIETGFADPRAISGHLLACDVVALPFKDGVSYRRGSFMAALAHGCAILTTPPAVPYPLLENVVTYSPPDPEKLAAALIDLANDPVRRAQLSSTARSLAPHFNWETIAAHTADVYRQAVARRV
jgi:glycosyltransferase involved in cell wall biosynthesis